MRDPTLLERAWGFSEDEYAEALGHVLPKLEARNEAAVMFERLRCGPSGSVGGDDHLFGLLSLVANDGAKRVQAIRRWTSDEMRMHQAEALRRRWNGDTTETE